MWRDLQPFLAPEKRAPAYLCGIVHKAPGKQNIGMEALTAHEAACLIDALKDRLAYAVKGAA